MRIRRFEMQMYFWDSSCRVKRCCFFFIYVEDVFCANHYASVRSYGVGYIVSVFRCSLSDVINVVCVLSRIIVVRCLYVLALTMFIFRNPLGIDCFRYHVGSPFDVSCLR